MGLAIVRTIVDAHRSRAQAMMANAGLVFIVGNDGSVQKSLSRIVTAAGYAGVFASAHEFLARPLSTGPCCLVLDVRMPGITGLDFQKTLAETVHRIPIVFVTGNGKNALFDAIARALAKDTRDRAARSASETSAGSVAELVRLADAT